MHLGGLKMTRRLEPEDLYAIKLVEDPQISADGARVAFVVMEIDRPTYEYRRAIWIAPADGGPPRRFTSGSNDTSPRWSPDGRAIAFVRAPAGEVKPKDESERDRGVGKGQVWVMPSDGGEARQLTSLRDGAGDPTWSPDGASIVFTAETGEPDDREAEDAALHEKRVPAVRTIDRLWHRLDGKGWIYERRAHLFQIPIDSGTLKQLTDGDWDDGSPAFSPSGRELAFISDRSAERWTWPGADIWVLELASGALRRITDETQSCGTLCWSPDGTTLGFTAQPRRKSNYYTDLYVAPAAGGERRKLTRGYKPTFSDEGIDDQRAGHHAPNPIFTADGSSVLALVSGEGSTQVVEVPLNGGTPRAITKPGRRIYALTADRAGARLAFASSTPTIPGDLFLGPVKGGEERRLTNLNQDFLNEIELASPEQFRFKGADGWDMQGWIVRPVHSRSQPAPAILEIHGGPMAMYGNSFFMEFQLLQARGFAIVYSNPRGSTGYGGDFSGAINNDWGGKDYEDIIAGLDYAVSKGWADPDRLGVAGGSYGGYMTNWAVGHTDRFKAAVTMRCVANMASMFGTSDIGWELTIEEMGGAVPWKDLDRIMERSPITYVDRITTPLLILHSDNDLRCPISEAEQMFSALKFLQREVKMKRFEGQTHDLSRNGHPRSRVIRLQAILDWFTSHIDANARSTPQAERTPAGAASST
jgi:dipeptidyl aminopeptidase/acylaminoacyl peptidase